MNDIDFYIVPAEQRVRRIIDGKEVNVKEDCYYFTMIQNYADKWGHTKSQILAKAVLTQKDFDALKEKVNGEISGKG